MWLRVSRVDMHSGKPRWNNRVYLEELVRVRANVLKAQTAQPEEEWMACGVNTSLAIFERFDENLAPKSFVCTVV